MNNFVTIVGCGALGSHVLQFLRNMENVSFRLIDFDRVEQKNVLSQFHSKAAVGKNKTLALQQLMQLLYSKKPDIIPHKLVENNVQELLSNSKLVIDCLDNGASRKLVQNFVRKHNIPCLHGALAADGSFGCVVWDENFKIDDEPASGAATCENGEHLPFIAIASAYIAQSAQAFLTKGQKYGFNVHPAGAMKI